METREPTSRHQREDTVMKSAFISTKPIGLGRPRFWIAAIVVHVLASVGATSAGAVCPPTPDTSCKFSYRASFAYTDSSTDTKDKLTFKLTKGASTAVGDFGDPTTTDGF